MTGHDTSGGQEGSRQPLATGQTASEDLVRAGQLRFAMILTGAVVGAEAVGGWLTGSLALLSDAGHMLSDVLSLALAYAAVRLAQRPPTPHRTFGWHRAEVFAAVANALALLAIAGWILVEAYQRLQHPPQVKTVPMLMVALVGLAVNWIVLRRLGGHSERDLNIHSAYLHVLGDLLASVGVVVGAGVMAATGAYLADPVISVGIALLITLGGLRVLGGAANILFEWAPRHLSVEDVAEAMRGVEGAEEVHHLHIWSICSHIIALSAHVVVGRDDEQHRREVRARLQHMLEHGFGITETTIELECGVACEPAEMIGEVRHARPPEHRHDHRHGDG